MESVHLDILFLRVIINIKNNKNDFYNALFNVQNAALNHNMLPLTVGSSSQRLNSFFNSAAVSSGLVTEWPIVLGSV